MDFVRFPACHVSQLTHRNGMSKSIGPKVSSCTGLWVDLSHPSSVEAIAKCAQLGYLPAWIASAWESPWCLPVYPCLP